MKIPILAVVALVSFAFCSESFAGEKGKTQKKLASKQKAECACAKKADTEYVYLTGSYIKQPISRNGLITDGSSQVNVIDSKAIQITGASDLRQVLTKYGYSNRR